VPDLADLIGPSMLGLGLIVALACATWLGSLRLRDVSIVDSAWSILILTPVIVAFCMLPGGPRSTVMLVLGAAWALRLAGHITWRHRGEPEDRRYREIRARNQPNFEWKSLYLVFLLQAVLAWLVSAPLVAAVASAVPWRWLDTVGVAVFAAGLVFESVADAQLLRFKRDPAHHGQVMAQGLWRYSRHPNYFGEFCVWWGAGLVGWSAGGWWGLISPLLMTWLLLKVSGVTLLERSIEERRPAYRDYIARTNAFFPGRPG
jgi:steroid 5-alpha reductase family enzyme